ncbi:MAG: Ldh family oxidoreductase [Pseudomonadota bacterium]
MPTLSPAAAEALAADLLKGAGASQEEASIVARHCINANLAGHDSHGIIKIPDYIASVKKGHVVPGAPYEVVSESPTTMVVDGNWGFGYTVTERAVAETIEKARTTNVAATTIRRQGHIGRLADYPLMAAEAGMIAMITADSGRAPKAVAPFGGAVARLGTNPICIAMPSNLDGPFYIDFATSAAAAGKLQVAISRGQQIPEGWLLDKDGNPTTDPTALKAGGAVLPLGGTEGYKGYGLSAMVELLSGVLTGLGFGVEPTGRHNDGVFYAVFNVEAFRPLETFKQEVTDFAKYLVETPTQPGVDRVYYPGEVEHVRAQTLRAEGLTIEDATWTKLSDLAQEFSVTMPST